MIIKHVPFQMKVATTYLGFVAEFNSDNELISLFADGYEQGKLKHYDVSFMLDELREDILNILENEDV